VTGAAFDPSLVDRSRLSGLRRMKLVATAALLVAAGIFVICRTVGNGDGGWPYLQAAAEAAMVGAFADWFAVTALFRHPLGLPIPHTAIIPRKKDQIGASLGDFVGENFLTADVVGPRLLSARIPHRVGEWLATGNRAERLSAELGTLLAGANAVLTDDEIRSAVEGYADRQLRRLPAAPLVARAIEVGVEGNQHQILLGHALEGLSKFLLDNRELFRQRVAEESPDWVPEWVDDRVFNRLFVGVRRFLDDVAADPEHELRRQFDARLADYARRLRTDPDTAAALESWKNDLLDHPAIRGALASLWTPMKAALLKAAADPDSQLRAAATSLLRQVGMALRDDAELQGKCDRWMLAASAHVLGHYQDEITGVISHTVQRWDAESTSRTLELQVGRDLQFIRINGTVVGAIVGLAIYSVGQVL
jgi:uncharacterized membrane-anchored protein YjiN (DUF445 family)